MRGEPIVAVLLGVILVLLVNMIPIAVEWKIIIVLLVVIVGLLIGFGMLLSNMFRW